MFQQPFNNIGMQNMQRFVEGRRLIHTNFSTGDHNEAGNDRYLQAVGLQGAALQSVGLYRLPCQQWPQPLHQLQLTRNSIACQYVWPARIQQDCKYPHPQYGTSVQMNAVSATGTPQNWGNSVNVGGFDTRTVKLADGSVVEITQAHAGL